MSNKEPAPDAEDEAAGGGGEVALAGNESNKLMMSVAALRCVVGCEEADEEATSFELEPKISARRSCVEGPAEALTDVGVAVLSSPIRSTIESLSVLVDPTGLRSLTSPSAIYWVKKHMLAYQYPSSSP